MELTKEEKKQIENFVKNYKEVSNKLINIYKFLDNLKNDITEENIDNVKEVLNKVEMSIKDGNDKVKQMEKDFDLHIESLKEKYGEENIDLSYLL